MDLVGGEGMVGGQAASAVPVVPVNPKVPLKSSLKGGLSKWFQGIVLTIFC